MSRKRLQKMSDTHEELKELKEERTHTLERLHSDVDRMEGALGQVTAAMPHISVSRVFYSIHTCDCSISIVYFT